LTKNLVEVKNQKSIGKLQSSIEIYIQELMLHGFAPYDRCRIGVAVEQELTRLFTEQGVPLSLIHGGEVARVDGGMLEMTSGSGAEQIGVRVAQAVFGALAM